MRKLIVILVVLLGMGTGDVFGQVNLKDSVVFAPILDFSYTLQFPGGDMVDRYGLNSAIGAAFYIKTRKNLYLGIDANFMFGRQVKEASIIQAFQDSKGGMLGLAGLYADLVFLERGFNISGKVGWLIPVISPNKNSGIMLMLGVGYIEHRIKIEDRLNEVPMLTSESYIAGYDRYTNGMLTSQFVGYRLLSSRRLINVFGGFEFMQGWTSSARPVNYDTGKSDSGSRIDLFYGIKVGFSLPFYKQVPKDYYYR